MDKLDKTSILAELIQKQLDLERDNIRLERTKQILLLLSQGAALALSLGAPNTAKLFKGLFRPKSDYQKWTKFNKKQLYRSLRDLKRQQIIEIDSENGIGVVKLTDKGKTSIYRFALDTIKVIKPLVWDRKWRLVIYDVMEFNKGTRERLRRYLKSVGFYPLQDSVYLHAYPCDDVVEFLRSYLGVKGEVRLVTASTIENDDIFKTYFGV